ncbi:DcaP family trimeric outer membrane transporter [Flavobacterium sp. KACC 22761]|uniref:DcaP family trimeric outer membrane transporter n=1 Tax=Flavobacterium sp. KACC 22761 TaxID=3092665 RepID=UPI002A758097|nr:DcaP family trimeric outer membrane transporter [Flavobacterium sp. KACC 22761]WPO80438.1 DcaP family trimeric outer membrane transporter [Flavobacterium sp. KACC 22761]
MKKKLFFLFLGILSLKGFSQTTKPETVSVIPTITAKEWDFNFYGFIRTDYIFDTRKSAQVREDNLNLYPLDKVLDANGADLNDVSASNILSIVSRVGLKIKGPNVWGAKMTGTLEGDFFGNTEASIGLVRLRHAYINMEWQKTSLLIGQTWYPAFIPEVFPGVANFNTGIMFNPFGWASQIKLKQNFTKELSFAATIYKEREFTTAAATGGTQNAASINSPLPTFHGQFQFKNKNWLAGIGAEYKSLQPLTEYAPTIDTKAKTSEKVNSTSFLGFVKYANDKISIKTYGITGGNMINFVMLGGFAGYSTPLNPEKYEAIKTSSFWIDVASNNKKIAPALFFGYTKNQGDGRNGLAVGETVKYYNRGISNSRVIDNVWRLSGRVEFKHNNFKITPELEYTAAQWGDLDKNANGKADLNLTTVGNFRTLLSCAYSF